MVEKKDFFTLSLVIDARKYVDAEKHTCHLVKCLQNRGIYVYETKISRGFMKHG